MSAKKELIRVQGFPVKVEDEYICLTDMANSVDKGKAGILIQSWLNTKSTIEFLGTWEAINNSTLFNVRGFQYVKNECPDRQTLSIRLWIEKTGGIGLFAREGKYGGTYAHRDIAFEFGTAISPIFKLYLIKEYQRLREVENNLQHVEWNIRRLLAKTGYHIQTDAIKKYKLPEVTLQPGQEYYAYAEEGDILNIAVFGFTAKKWRENNLDLAAKGENVREYASINELMVISNLETLNAQLIKDKKCYNDRLKILNETSQEQLNVLTDLNPTNSFRKNIRGELRPYFKKDSLGMFPERNVEIEDGSKTLEAAKK